MGEDTMLTAQLVMRRDDGRSILDVAGAITAASPALTAGNVTPDRAEDIKGRLGRAGFTVTGGNLNTLSITGSTVLFTQVFGIDPGRPAKDGVPHAERIPDDLKPFIADVFVPPPPEFFP